MLTEEKGLKNNSKVLGLGTMNIMAIYCFGGIRRGSGIYSGPY